MKTIRLPARRISSLLAATVSLTMLTGCATTTPIVLGTFTAKTILNEDSVVPVPDQHPTHPGPHQTSIAITTKGAAIKVSDIHAGVTPDRHHIIIVVSTQDRFEPKLAKP